MRKFIFNIILVLLPIWGYSQSGMGYVNYKSYKTHYGNGNSSTYNGVTYSGISNNINELIAVLDVNQPGTTLTHQGEISAYSDGGFINGRAPRWNGEFYAVHHWGWFQPRETGRYRFALSSDDASALWIDDELKLFRPCCGTSYVDVNLTAGKWYRIDTKWQEYTGGDYMRLTYSPPSSTSYWLFGSNPNQLKVTNNELNTILPHKLDITYNINDNLDKTKFNTTINFPSLNTTTTSTNLSSNGMVNYDENNGIDTTKYSMGKKATTTAGSVEWCIIYDYDSNLGGHRFLIDDREFRNTNVNPQNVNKIQLFDIYDGDVTIYNISGFWKQYILPGDLTTEITNSNYQSYLRRQNNWYGTRAEVSFEDVEGFTPHEIILGVDETYWSTQNIISIQDIALSFSELTSNNGPGLGSGGTFTTGIEYLLGDVNQDGSFDFQDTQLMLQYLFGDIDPFVSQTFTDKLRMFESGYDSWSINEWSTNIPNTNKFIHTLDESNKEKTKSLDIAFLGDVNFSHSYQPLNLTTVGNSLSRTMSLFRENTTENINLSIEKVGENVKLNINIPINQKNITGSQFKIYFDNNRIEYVNTEYSNQSIPNFSTNRNNYVNVGSFSGDGSQNLNEGINYTINFKLKEDLQSILGLVAVTFVELVDKNGQKINLDIK